MLPCLFSVLLSCLVVISVTSPGTKLVGSLWRLRLESILASHPSPRWRCFNTKNSSEKIWWKLWFNWLTSLFCSWFNYGLTGYITGEKSTFFLSKKKAVQWWSLWRLRRGASNALAVLKSPTCKVNASVLGDEAGYHGKTHGKICENPLVLYSWPMFFITGGYPWVTCLHFFDLREVRIFSIAWDDVHFLLITGMIQKIANGWWLGDARRNRAITAMHGTSLIQIIKHRLEKIWTSHYLKLWKSEDDDSMKSGFVWSFFCRVNLLILVQAPRSQDATRDLRRQLVVIKHGWMGNPLFHWSFEWDKRGKEKQMGGFARKSRLMSRHQDDPPWPTHVT